jgi:probable FeS assembly SUF system protein SufT
MRYEEVTLVRDCQVVQIPYGNNVTLRAGTGAVVTQSLGDSFTIQVPEFGGLYRLAGNDADAIGKPPPVPVADGAADGPVDEEVLWNVLRTVYDPEIPVNIVELGLVYDLRVEPIEGGGSRVLCRMTLTAPGCGMGEIIAAEAKRQLEKVPGVKDAQVDLVFDPPWNQEMMSEAAKLELGMM